MSRLVAITGATGFIGWHVARRFHEQGWQVRAIVRPDSDRPVPSGVERVTASLQEAPVTAACQGAQVIIHLAAAIRARSDQEFTQANVDVTAAVARAAATLDARLIHISSLGVTGPGDPGNPPREDDPPHPINMYGESKRQSELVVRSLSALRWTILRPTLVYGPRDRLFQPVFRLARYGLFPVPHPAAVYNLIHVDDVARGVEAALSERAVGETFFLGHPTHVTMHDMLTQLAAVVGTRFRPLRVPRPLLRAAAEVGTLASKIGWRLPLDRARLREMYEDGFVCRTDKARDRLGFAAEIALIDGFRETAAWYLREGWI